MAKYVNTLVLAGDEDTKLMMSPMFSGSATLASCKKTDK
jgi:hypothetical protein